MARLRPRSRRQHTANTTWGARLRRWLQRLLLGIILLVLGLQVLLLVSVALLRWVNPPTTAFMVQQYFELRSANPPRAIRQTWVPYRAISDHLKRAVIAAEDANFADHDGVDWNAIERAYADNQRQGKPVRGGSTITMQLAKNLFLSGERSYLRKAQELVITYMLELMLSKQRILEIYLNVAEWGIGVFGAESAARYYFGSTAAQLGPEQGARLASMLPRPRFYDRNRQSGALARKTAIIVRRAPSAELP